MTIISRTPVSPTRTDSPIPTLRVASIPSSHVYVQHLNPVAELAPVHRLADPDPDDPRRSAVSRWWPPAMLEADWVHEHADEFDLMHLQFGFDARTPEQLADLLQALADERKPLVYTVHDLRNPHHASPEEHDAQLDVLIPGADRLVTLTPGAAAQIQRRWGRSALVLPHPHVVDLETMRRLRRERHVRAEGRAAQASDRRFVVGLHVKSL
ncbi:MAG: hypothetical protein Q7T71_19965, partial [Herbiconiux sp.]|nr:hypothetical protein [Herbiconiux sp.]